MTHPLGAVALAFVCALVSAWATSRHILARDRDRLTLARIDLISFALNVGGVLSLTPEILGAFAPELVDEHKLAASALANLDYAAYVFVPIGVGMGLARRWHIIINERAALAASPAA